MFSGKSLQCEAKPKNIISSSNKKRKLDGSGNFTDYTHKRLDKDLRNDLQMLVSGFVDGKLIYILEFPFNYTDFKNRLKEQLNKKFPKGDREGFYLRSANFNYKHFENCSELKIIYCLDKNDLEVYKNFIQKNLLEILFKGVSK